MIKIIPLIPLILCLTANFIMAQTNGEIIHIESQATSFSIPAKKIIVEDKAVMPATVKMLEKELNDYIEVMHIDRVISKNVVVSINSEIIEEPELTGIKVTYTYVLKNDTLSYETDDFGAGKYRLDDSNAMQVTLEAMKRSIQKQLLGYINDSTQIDFKIQGSADAVPINGRIKYDGSYGAEIEDSCFVNGTKQSLLVNSTEGVKNNQQLAFLRSYTVKNYLETEIPEIKNTSKSYEHTAKVSLYKGGEYRRVSIEMIIKNKLSNSN